MSDSRPEYGDGWWQASNDKWYPPNQHPDRPPPPDNRPPPPKPTVPTESPPTGAEGSPQPGSQPDTVWGKKTSGGWGLVVIAIIGGLIVLCGWGFIFGSDPNTYAASVVDAEMVNPASLRVFVEVTNTGESRDRPSCTVRVSDSGGAYSGFGTFDVTESIGPGETTRFNGSVVVTSEGAAFVDDFQVECK